MTGYARFVCWLGALAAACSSDAPPPKTAHETPRSTSSKPRPPRPALEAALDLPPGDVVRAMRTNEKRMRMCFFQAPQASGFVRIGWHVDPSGAVERVKVRQSTIDNSHVEKCLATRVEELRFDQQPRSAKGEWTYVFRLARPSEEPKRDQRAKERARRAKERARANTKPGVVLETTSPGSIDTDKVDEIVQASYPLFARCYRDAIARDSGLEGWVGLRFVIDRSGRVSRVLDGDSDLEDPMALDCIAESFYALKFPKPRGGNAHVLYRMRLN